MKKILLLLGCIFTCCLIGVKASVLISSNQVIYKDNKTVSYALDDLINELSVGKDKLAQSITNKGINTTSDNTLEEMANNVDNISLGNTELRYNEEEGYIQALDTNGNWKNIYKTSQFPILAFDGVLYDNGNYNSNYFSLDYITKIKNNSCKLDTSGTNLYLYANGGENQGSYVG